MAKQTTFTIDCSKEDLLLSISNLMDAKFCSFREEIYLRMEDLETSLTQKMNNLETSLNTRMDYLETSLNTKMDTLETDLRVIKLTNENIIVPRLNEIEKCYTDTYYYYKERVTHVESHDMDIVVIKSAMQKHDERISNLEKIVG